MEHELFVCACADIEHQMVLSYFDDEPEVYVSIHLKKHGFFVRLLTAIKYLFGKQSMYGAFEEIILNDSSVERLNNILTERIKFINATKKC